jgi:hypothetical protein
LPIIASPLRFGAASAFATDGATSGVESNPRSTLALISVIGRFPTSFTSAVAAPWRDKPARQGKTFVLIREHVVFLRKFFLLVVRTVFS